MHTAGMEISAILHASVFLAFVIHGGRSDEIDSTRNIVKGENISKGKFPFMVSLRKARNNEHFCGATILTKNWLLTAAHCCKNVTPDDVYVKSGTVFLDLGGTNSFVEEIIPHENFNQVYRNGNDVCVIHVKEPFTFNRNVHQVTLPNKYFPVNPGDQVITAGWGKIDPFGKKSPKVLQKSDDFVLISNEECGKEANVPTFPGYICIRGAKKGRALCFGDSGGPLLRNGVQIGITSWSLLPCRYPFSTFFTNATHYTDWIKDKLGPDADDLKLTE